MTTPTPYDPPLTYGGWNQSKKLGSRIASILRTRETDDELLLGVVDNGGNRRKRRHKIVIHSSPFLRCVQSSIAISAGLAQNPGHTLIRPSSSYSQTKLADMHSSPSLRPRLVTDSPALSPIPEPAFSLSDNIRKSTLRVDAFLGEWMNPDYFDQITPPPSSHLMLGAAKTELLRKEDYTAILENQKIAPSRPFPGGWGSPIEGTSTHLIDNDLTLASLSSALPRRDRTSSLSTSGVNGGSLRRARSPNSMTLPTYAEHGVYQPPIPAYAVSSSDEIPVGYVAHARDACVDIDYQWDSSQEPQDWGSGGEYGEEWSDMHKRFRKGLDKMVRWYNESEDPATHMAKTPTSPAFAPIDDGDEDLVLVLVTHGAGCNALIGALTNQPAVLDVGMSSLTMAVLKSALSSSPGHSPKSHSHSTSKPHTLADDYDVPLIANTEHLRSTQATPSSSRHGSSVTIPRFRDPDRRGSGFDGSLDESYGICKVPLGSIRRVASVPTSGPYMPNPRQTIGLWTPPGEKVWLLHLP